MTFAVFKGGLALVLAAPEGPERDATSAELKKVLFRYLDPIVGSALETGPVAATPSPADRPVTTTPRP